MAKKKREKEVKVTEQEVIDTELIDDDGVDSSPDDVTNSEEDEDWGQDDLPEESESGEKHREPDLRKPKRPYTPLMASGRGVDHSEEEEDEGVKKENKEKINNEREEIYFDSEEKDGILKEKQPDLDDEGLPVPMPEGNEVVTKKRQSLDKRVKKGLIVYDSGKYVIAVGRFCKNCYLAETCPVFEKNSKCSLEHYEDGEPLLPTLQNGADIGNSLMDLLALQLKRIRNMELIEQVEGGFVYEDLSREMDRYFALAQKVKELFSEQKDTISIQADVKSGSGGGLLAQLLGGKK